MLRKGQNPRLVLEKHKERGPKKFIIELTYEDLADLFGMTETAVRKAVSRGSFDPGSVHSIVEYLLERQESNLRDLVQEARSLTGIED